jgi:hypothetical protein
MTSVSRRVPTAPFERETAASKGRYDHCSTDEPDYVSFNNRFNMETITMKTTTLFATLSICGILSFAAPAFAQPVITFDYAAEGNGGTVTGTFGYDLAVADSNVDPDYGFYLQSGFLTATVNGGDQDGGIINNTALNLYVSDNAPNAGKTRDILNLGFSSGIRLFDFEGTAFSSDAFPSNLILADFEIAQITLAGISHLG